MTETLIRIEGTGVRLLFGGFLTLAMFIGLLLMASGGLWLGLLAASKIEEAILYRLDFNREFIAFAWDRFRKRRAGKGE